MFDALNGHIRIPCKICNKYDLLIIYLLVIEKAFSKWELVVWTRSPKKSLEEYRKESLKELRDDSRKESLEEPRMNPARNPRGNPLRNPEVISKRIPRGVPKRIH